MPALHVVGEILGAAGLAHEHALSLTRVLDLLALEPSSKRSFFCRWRLLDSASDDSDRECESANAWSATWEVLRGQRHGQTQVHCPASSLSVPLLCPATSAAGTADTNDKQELLLLDVVWSHPIEMHLTSAPAFSGWPHLEFEVWSLDAFNQTQLCGVARVCIPSASGEYVLDVPLTHTISDSWLERITEHLSLATSKRSHSFSTTTRCGDTMASTRQGARAKGGEGSLVEPSGTVFVRIAVLQSSF